MGYVIFFVANFVVAYYIYDQTNFVKPLVQSVFLLIMVVVIDLIKSKNKN
jgi:hypothetical protein